MGQLDSVEQAAWPDSYEASLDSGLAGYRSSCQVGRGRGGNVGNERVNHHRLLLVFVSPELLVGLVLARLSRAGKVVDGPSKDVFDSFLTYSTE